MSAYDHHDRGDCWPDTCPVCQQECDRCGHLGLPCDCDDDQEDDE